MEHKFDINDFYRIEYCIGTLRDAAEGKQQVLLFYEFMNIEDEKLAENQNSRRILRRLLSAFKK